MNSSLSLKDLCDLVLTLNDKIDWYWNFYVVSLIALLSFLSSQKFTLNKKQKFVLIIGFLVFGIMNLMALINTSRAALVLVEELKFRVKNTTLNLSPSTRYFIQGLPTNYGSYISIAVHAIVDPLIIFFIATLPSPSKRLLRYLSETEPE